MLSNEDTNNRVIRALPDLQVCRAADLTGTFAECLVAKPHGCQYAMPFGYSYLCGHPDRNAIIENTKRSQPKR